VAEGDIDAIIAMADGAPYGNAMRGAMTTLKTRPTVTDVGTTIVGAIDGYRPMYSQAHGSSGLLAWNWVNGNYRRVTSAGFNITGISESSGPSGDIMRVGVVAVFNTHGSNSITVDFTAYGAEEVATIPAGEADIFMIFSVPAP